MGDADGTGRGSTTGVPAAVADPRHCCCYPRRAMTAPRTIVQKIWDDHVVTQDPGAPAALAVDLHLIHEVTSPQAFSGLRWSVACASAGP